MGCLPSWADELMSGFNANLLNWHTAWWSERRRNAATLQPPKEKNGAQLGEETKDERKRKKCVREGKGVCICVFV